MLLSDNGAFMRIQLIKYPSRLIACLFSILLFSCSIPTRQPSYFDKQPILLKNQYTPDEIAILEKNFESNPTQHSKEYGNLILWQMHQKSPEFALEFARTPEIVDGINAQEGKAMASIYGLIEGIDIPAGLFIKKDAPQQGIRMEWRGNSKDKVSWKFYFGNIFPRDIVRTESIGFEPGEDEIYYKVISSGEKDLRWRSKVNLDDSDGVIIYLDYSARKKISLNVNREVLTFSLADVSAKDKLVFAEKDGLKGTLTIQNAYKTNLSPELLMLKDMVLSGEGEYRSSPALRALFKGYMDGKFKEGDNPLKNYQDIAEFVMRVLDYMRGEEFRNYEYTSSWMGDPRIFDSYINKNYRKITLPESKSHSVSDVFNSKEAWCGEMGMMGIDMVNPHGFNGNLYWDLNWPARQRWASAYAVSGHTVAAYEEGGLMHIFVDWTRHGNRMYNMTKKEFNKRFQLRTESLPGW